MTDSRSTTLNLPQEIGEVIRDVLEKHNPEWADEFAFTLAVCVLEGNIHTVSYLCPQHQENGRASCRERVCTYVSIPVLGVSLKKKKSTHDQQSPLAISPTNTIKTSQ